MKESVSLHFEEFVTILSLLDASLEVDQFTSSWFDIQSQNITSKFFLFASNSLFLLFRMILLDEFLVKSDEILCVDAGHEIPTEIQSLIDGSIFIPILPQELILEDICELQKLQISLIKRILSDNRNESSQFSALRICCIHLIADFLVIVPRSLLTNTGPHQPG